MHSLTDQDCSPPTFQHPFATDALSHEAIVDGDQRLVVSGLTVVREVVSSAAYGPPPVGHDVVSSSAPSRLPAVHEVVLPAPNTEPTVQHVS